MQRIRIGFLAAFVLAASLSAAARAQTEPINLVLAINQPIDLWFENEVDPAHPKLLTFKGMLANPTDVDGVFNFFFDWTDLEKQETFTSEVFQIPVGALSELEFEQQYWIDFCPPCVSLHMRLATSEVMYVQGEFSHVCIPEASSVLTLGASVLGLGGMAARRLLRRRRD
jgi:hypothetical protein